MSEQHLTMEGIYKAYPREKFIHIVPSVSKHQLGTSMYGIDVATVKIDPYDGKMVYKLKEVYNKQTREYDVVEVGLKAAALNIIAGAADVNVVPETVEDNKDRGLLVIRAHAIMQTPGGAVRTRSAQVRWEKTLMRERLWQRAVSYVRRGVDGGWDKMKNKTDEQLNAMVQEKFDREWLDEQILGPRAAESKAARNAIKLLLGVPDAWDPKELDAKEFAVVKYVFAPDLSDPQTKQMMIEAGIRSQRAVFGMNLAVSTGSTFLPMDSSAGVALPPPDQDDDVALEADLSDEAEDQGDRPAGQENAADSASEVLVMEENDKTAIEFLTDKVKSAKAIPHLSNIDNKYRDSAAHHGIAGEFAALVKARHAELTGEPPHVAVTWGEAEQIVAKAVSNLIRTKLQNGEKQSVVDSLTLRLADATTDRDAEALKDLFRELRGAK